MVDLPAEIWSHILLAFVPEKDLCRLYPVNRVFYELSLNARHKILKVYLRLDQPLLSLSKTIRLRDHGVLLRVRELELLDNVQTYSLSRKSGYRHQYLWTKNELKRYAQCSESKAKLLSTRKALRILSSFTSSIDPIWKEACEEGHQHVQSLHTVRMLRIHLHHEGPGLDTTRLHLFRLVLATSPVESIEIQAAYTAFVLLTSTFSKLPSIPSVSYLGLKMSQCWVQNPSGRLFSQFASSFPNLRKLNIYLDWDMDFGHVASLPGYESLLAPFQQPGQFPDLSEFTLTAPYSQMTREVNRWDHLTRFLDEHSKTLRLLCLLTFEPYFGVLEADGRTWAPEVLLADPWFARTLPKLHLKRLENLQIFPPQTKEGFRGFQAFLRSSASTLRSLRIFGCGLHCQHWKETCGAVLAPEDVACLLGAFSNRDGVVSLESLDLPVECLDIKLLDDVVGLCPSVQELSIQWCRKAAAGRGASEIPFEDLHNRTYDHWRRVSFTLLGSGQDVWQVIERAISNAERVDTPT